jgi:hypothetical protein
MQFYDDRSFYDQYFAYGHEFGTTHVIRCDGESSAYEIAIDESPTIEPDEVPEAYGFYFRQAKHWSAPDNGEPWYICSDNEKHGQIISASVLKCNGDRRCLGDWVEVEEHRPIDGFWRFIPQFPTKKAAIAFAMDYIRMHGLELIEGYQYQSNSSGTGIVNTGHYEWLRKADADEIAAFKQAIPDESDE